MNKSYRGTFLLFTLVWLAFCWPWLSGKVTIPYDAKAHFQAQIQFLAHAIHQGQSPFWAPNVFAGSPQIADPQSLIFSPALLIALLSPDPTFWMVDLYTYLLLAMGGFAIIAFAKDRGWHPAAALLAASIFAFGSSAAWRVQHLGQIQSHAFLALSLWTLARALQRRSRLWGLLAGLSAGFMVVEPDQVAYLGVIVLAAIMIDDWLASGATLQRVRSSLPVLGAGALGGILVVSGPLLMTVLFAESSNRPEIPYAEAVLGSLSPAAFLTFFFGDLFAASENAVPYWGPSSPIWSPMNYFLSPNMTQVYCGSMAAIILCIGVFSRQIWAREIRVYMVLLGFAVIYALGSFTPLFQWLFDLLPGVSAFRRPADATFTFGFIVSIIAGFLLDRLLTGQMKLSWLRTVFLPAGLFLALVAYALWAGGTVHHLNQASTKIATAFGWLSLSAIVLIALKRFDRRWPALPMVLLAFSLAPDLAYNNGPSESTGLPPKSYEALDPDTKNPTIGFLKDHTKAPFHSPRRDRVELVGVGFYWPNIGLVHGFDHTLGYNPLRLADFTAATGAGDTIAGPDQRQFSKLFPSYRCLLADLLGLRFIASSIPIEQVDKKLKPGDLSIVARTKDAIIYENKRALPRAMFVHDYRIADFEQLIQTGQWPDFDPRRTVLLEQMPDAPASVAPPKPTIANITQASLKPSELREGGPHAAAIQMDVYHNTQVLIEVDSDEAGFVVLNDVWHPWWQATVDGQQVEILKANVLFRAVPVPAGRHKVMFEFKPFAGAFAELEEKLFERN